jgi:monoamine oxidase
MMLGVALALTTPALAGPPPPTAADHDVIIVGAGAAGLYAAFELNGMGFDVLVLEATGRHGGRVEPRMQGTVEVEVHACCVTGSGRANWHYQDIQNLDANRLVRRGGGPKRDTLYSVGGKTVLASEVARRGDPDEDIRDYWHNYDSTWRYRGPDIDAETYVCETIGVCRGHQAYHLYDSGYPAGDYTTSLGQIGQRSLAEQEFNWGIGPGLYGFTTGTYLDTLEELYFTPEVLSLVQLNSAVTEIDTSGGVAVVTHSKNKTVTAHAVLVTVPLGVLQAGDIAFTPALSAAKQAAMGTLGAGNGGKMILEFSTAFWPDGTVNWHTEGPAGWCGSFYWLGDDGAKIVSCFVMGENAEFMDSLGSEAAALAQGLADLDAMYPGTPFSDTFVGGFPGIGSYPTDGSPSAREVLAQQVGTNLYFAGEATHNSAPATVTGALDTGLRAADEIDADHDPQPWRNHGQYVRCVAQDAKALVEAGLFTQDEAGALVSSSAQTDVGKKGFVPDPGQCAE